MFRKIILLFLPLILSILILPISACGSGAKPSYELKEVPVAEAPGATPAWEEDWNNTIKAAQREGKLIIYSGSNPEIREAQAKAFKERFGIIVEAVPGSPNQIGVKILGEYRANIHYVDIYSGGVSTSLTTLKPGGVLVSLDRVLVLPEVLDPNVWYENRIPFMDEAHTTAAITLFPAAGFMINTSLVKPGEINSYNDLLEPKWKGKIILADPTMPPGGDKWFITYVHNNALSLDYMRALVRQEPFISRDRRIAVEWLSRGKYAISIGTGWINFKEFAEAGLPVKRVDPLEGDYLAVGAGALGLMKNPSHPNAAKVFVNWFFSKEGAAVISRAYDAHSTRLDVAVEGLNQLRQPGLKYLESDKEEIYLKMPEYRKMAREIFGDLVR